MEITQRELTHVEIDALIKDIQSFPDLNYVSVQQWKDLNSCFVGEEKSHFVGCCVVHQFDEWVKIGPVVILKKYQGRGFGRKLLLSVIQQHCVSNIVVTSSSPAIAKILLKLGGCEVSFWEFPFKVQFFLLGQLLENLHIEHIVEFFRKRRSRIYRKGEEEIFREKKRKAVFDIGIVY